MLDVDEGDGQIDSDNDGKPNSLDIDSDNDGITDNVEWQEENNYVAPSGFDANGDGWDDVYDGTLGGAYYLSVNTDGDNLPDYLDVDTDNDGYMDYMEGHDANSDTIADVLPTGVDSDNDGLDDAYDIVDGWSAAGNSTGSNAPLQDSPETIWENDVLIETIAPDGIRDWRDPDLVIDVYFIAPPPPTDCEVFIPNGFSPNDDGINDFFLVDWCELEIPEVEIEIYNRWGNLVYKKDGYGNEGRWGSDAWWDGRSNVGWTVGKDRLPPGTYFYVLQLENGNEPKAGSIFLSN